MGWKWLAGKNNCLRKFFLTAQTPRRYPSAECPALRKSVKKFEPKKGAGRLSRHNK